MILRSHQTTEDFSRRVVLIGGGGHAKVCIEIIRQNSDLELAAIISIDKPKTGLFVPWYRDIPHDAELNKTNAQWVHVGIGDNLTRRRRMEAAIEAGLAPLTLQCRYSFVHDEVLIGRGCLIATGATIVVGSRLDHGVIVNTGAQIDHDCRVGAFSHIAPAATLAGDCEIGRNVLVGISAVVLPGITIGNNCVIGGNSTVTRDIPSGSVVIGSPARVIKRMEISE